LYHYDDIKINKFIELITHINSLLISEIDSIYAENWEKINHNYVFINYLFELSRSIWKKYEVIKRN